MDEQNLVLAADIISKSSRERPADAVLREKLKAQRELWGGDATEISRAVFSYYRWQGWVESGIPSSGQIKQALLLAEQFRNRPETFSDAELVGRAVPGWLQNEMDISPAWIRAIQAEPRLWLRARKGLGKALAAELGNAGIHGEGPLADTLEYHGSEDLFRTPQFHAGAFEVQDLASQAVGLICAPQPGQTWWDVCAGEGGKLLHLSDMMNNRGLIWATDKAEWRLKKLQRRTARARVFNYRLRTWNGGPRLPFKTCFDGVLVDAPCAGIGTWQRNPHARWTTTPQDLRELAEIQHQLLVNLLPAIKRGGKLIYAVCTLSRSETTEVVARLKDRLSNFSPLEITNPLEPKSTPRPELLLRSEDTGANGMFIAGWTRIG